MDYKAFNIRVADPAFIEILQAELAEAGFESFQSDGNKLAAYVAKSNFDQNSTDSVLQAYQAALDDVQVVDVPHQNWNAVWESNYEPVVIADRIFIGAPFHHVPDEVEYKLALDPNMSFGTGHHPTTNMILGAMLAYDFSGKSFLDFGCGSAVLGILACKMGAEGLGIEIDEHAANAAAANVQLNNVPDMTVVCGDATSIPSQEFDYIFANINRNVIEETLQLLLAVTHSDSKLFFAGFLRSDSAELQSNMERCGLCIENVEHMEEWSMITAKKQS